ncbi:uncharacterized protein LOC130787631 [Actinidia eriantha]|uniref:uncharacterized protein LOC130787631 n=1 Tax=Actinidia eriantha TaxID=165200 RepID=UPI0025865CC7|nr:uncharacterized protein LOC130787631 [Actinidia eriantha]XP_057504012.1 uncharacterized protein LOC130787631 [Actinidia eriantha]XP_057504013.1 uncharacterized protein LOC130787631 [Actinidia eriantha]XP_057504014.1 uncharacterized protein LOC130787631 [Actinidia eriantha]
MSGRECIANKDPMWKYYYMIDPAKRDKLKCNFCGKVISGGGFQMKQHYVRGFRNLTICPRCPSEIREEMQNYMAKKQSDKEQMHMMPDFDEMDNELEDDEDDIVRTNRHGKSIQSSQSFIFVLPKLKKPKTKGPMDTFFTPNPDVVVQNREKQIKINANDPYKKELRDRAVTRFIRWMYDAGIAFNAVNYPSFGPMIESIGQYGPDMKPPSYHETRATYRKKELAHTNDLMKDHRDNWVKYGCFIMADGWIDGKGKTLINFLVCCPKGSMFIESIDASSYSMDGQKLFKLLDKYVKFVGEVNVIQIVTDNASANLLAGKNLIFRKFLEAKRPNLYWTPCAVHCTDLILEDIFKIPKFKSVLKRPL